MQPVHIIKHFIINTVVASLESSRQDTETEMVVNNPQWGSFFISKVQERASVLYLGGEEEMTGRVV